MSVNLLTLTALIVAVSVTAQHLEIRRQEPPIDAGSQSSDQPTFRQFAFLSTRTSIQIVTTTITYTTKTICASLVNVTGACARRRRGLADKPIVLSFDDNEDIDLYNPSPVQKIQSTVAPPTADDLARTLQLEGTRHPELIEVDITGLHSDCVQRRNFGLNLLNLFGITLRKTTTLTATISVTTTVTSGSQAFYISQCTPNPFLYSVC